MIFTNNKIFGLVDIGQMGLRRYARLVSTVQVVKSRRMRWAGHVACMGERRGVYRILVGKPEGKSLLVRVSCRREDNIKMNLQEVGCGAWTGSIWLRIATGGGHL